MKYSSGSFMKKVLIVGLKSYIGLSVENYLKQFEGMYKVDKLGSRELKPVPGMFAGYDVVIFTAGIAHRKETHKNASLYYEVNRDLAISVACMAKKDGISQFIILSSMAVYGVRKGHILKSTPAFPYNNYGKSKLQADEQIIKLNDENFKVAILRPPMVYGKGCKGNYQPMRKFALISPVFPNIKNSKSMIYIGNLCEFIKAIIDEKKGGIFLPQNAEYVTTSEMIKLIAETHGKKVHLISVFNPFVKLLLPIKKISLVFDNYTIEKTDCIDKFDLETSILLTEK